MGTTPGGIPYPEGSDIPDVSYWLQQMAEALDTAMRPQIQVGRVSMSLGGAAYVTTPIVFANPFPAAPEVFATYGQASTSPPLVVGAFDPTPTGFTLMMQTASGATATSTRTVRWLAVLPL